MFLTVHSTPKKRARGNTIEKIVQKPPPSLFPLLFAQKNHYFPLTPMPSLFVPMTKQQGKVDKAAHQLNVEGKVNIKDLSLKNIDAIHACWFPTPTAALNFWLNVNDFSSSLNLKRHLPGQDGNSQHKVRSAFVFCSLIVI
jgi:hypothetical protein